MDRIKGQLSVSQNKNDVTEKSLHKVKDSLTAETDAHSKEVKQATTLEEELRSLFEQEKTNHIQAQKKVQALGSALDEAKIKSDGLKDELRVLNEQIAVKNLDMVSSQKRIDKLNAEIVKAQTTSDKEKEKIMAVRVDMENEKNNYVSTKEVDQQK